MFGRHFRRRESLPWEEEIEEEHEARGPGGRRERWFRERGHGPWHGRHFGHGRPPFFEGRDERAWFGPGGRGRGGRHFGHGGPFAGDPFDEDDGGRQRQRRGDIKYALLELLAEQPRHGYDLIKELEQRYAGFYRPSPGSVYPTLQLLEDEGHLTSEQVEGKRIYTITDSGRQLLAERQRQAGPEGPRRPGFRGRDPNPDLEALRRSGMAMVSGLMQVARHGSPAQVRAVMELIESTRREIYAILSRPDADESA